MVMLHDAIKTIQNGVFVFFLKSKNLFFQKKQKHPDLERNEKTQVGCFFFKLVFFLKPGYLSILFL